MSGAAATSGEPIPGVIVKARSKPDGEPEGSGRGSPAQAGAMSVRMATRGTPIARSPRQTRAREAAPVRTWQRSSSKGTSRAQWTRLSISVAADQREQAGRAGLIAVRMVTLLGDLGPAARSVQGGGVPLDAEDLTRCGKTPTLRTSARRSPRARRWPGWCGFLAGVSGRLAFLGVEDSGQIQPTSSIQLPPTRTPLIHDSLGRGAAPLIRSGSWASSSAARGAGVALVGGGPR